MPKKQRDAPDSTQTLAPSGSLESGAGCTPSPTSLCAFAASSRMLRARTCTHVCACAVWHRSTDWDPSWNQRGFPLFNKIKLNHKVRLKQRKNQSWNDLRPAPESNRPPAIDTSQLAYEALVRATATSLPSSCINWSRSAILHDELEKKSIRTI